jgi:WD40 repeat protein
VARLQLSSGAVFCVNRAGGSPDGRSYYVTGGSDGVVRVVQRRDAPGLDPVHVVAEQPLPTDGIMGMSVDPHAGTMVTGSTSGIVGSWRLHHQEVTRLDSLPVSQLKALLKQRSIPIDDLREKQELVSRIRLLNAAPLLTPLARFREHAGSNVIGAAHAGDVAVTGDDGGEAYVWSTSTGARLHALPHPQGEGVDATGVDVPAGRAFTGCKDGSTRAWDLETGAKVFEWNRAAGRGRWVWVVKSGSSSFAGEGPFSGASSPVFPDILFSAGTDGYVRLFDLRDSRLAQSVKATRSEDAEQQMLFPGGFHSVPITAVVPQLAHNRFITAGFDGCVRVFDFRKFEATQTIRAATDVRLSRADADHDTIMVGAASDGSVRMIPFDV